MDGRCTATTTKPASGVDHGNNAQHQCQPALGSDVLGAATDQVDFATVAKVSVSFIRTHPDLDLTVLHGVRDPGDLFHQNAFAGIDYLPCISGEPVPEGMFAGRVTEAVASGIRTWPGGARFYLCGSNPMILEVRRMLLKLGILDRDVVSEAYHYG